MYLFRREGIKDLGPTPVPSDPEAEAKRAKAAAKARAVAKAAKKGGGARGRGGGGGEEEEGGGESAEADPYGALAPRMAEKGDAIGYGVEHGSGAPKTPQVLFCTPPRPFGHC